MGKLSIIIPALNESQFIAKSLDTLISNKYFADLPEFVVVDSGSSDNTVDIVSEYGFKLISHIPTKSGKYELLNRGAMESCGNTLLFLDADTLLPGNYDLLIDKALTGYKVVGGAFEFSLNGDEFGLRVVEFINRLRYRVRSSFYGDQGLFVNREIFFKAGMFPKRRLFETSELCQKLRRFGKLKIIKQPALTSPRRFVDGGIYCALMNDIMLWFINKFNLYSDDKMADLYWNYNRRK